ncbi:MAG TPA: ClpXP protease specificity-enhancing factor SspB [Acetobacteraceae bacterium]
MEDDGDGSKDGGGEDAPVESLLPYDRWTEEAQRHVLVQALKHAARHGLPGEHHFYLTFRTDHPDTEIPSRLRAQYPQEMTIVLQHQYRDLLVDEAAGVVSVGLSFGGVPSTLRIPLGAVIAFADPHVRYGLRFNPDIPEPVPEAEAEPEDEPGQAAEPPSEAPQVVSLDAFRRRTPPKD